VYEYIKNLLFRLRLVYMTLLFVNYPCNKIGPNRYSVKEFLLLLHLFFVNGYMISEYYFFIYFRIRNSELSCVASG